MKKLTLRFSKSQIVGKIITKGKQHTKIIKLIGPTVISPRYKKPRIMWTYECSIVNPKKKDRK